MGRTSAPRRRVALLYAASGRWSRRGREVLLAKQDLPKSATAPDSKLAHWIVCRGIAVLINSPSTFDDPDSQRAATSNGVGITGMFGHSNTIVVLVLRETVLVLVIE